MILRSKGEPANKPVVSTEPGSNSAIVILPTEGDEGVVIMGELLVVSDGGDERDIYSFSPKFYFQGLLPR